MSVRGEDTRLCHCVFIFWPSCPSTFCPAINVPLVYQILYLILQCRANEGRVGEEELQSHFPFPPTKPGHLRYSSLTVTLSYEPIATYDEWTSSGLKTILWYISFVNIITNIQMILDFSFEFQLCNDYSGDNIASEAKNNQFHQLWIFAALKGAATVTVHLEGLFLAALPALDLLLVSDLQGDRFEFGRREWLLRSETLQASDQSDVWMKRRKDKKTKRPNRDMILWC